MRMFTVFSTLFLLAAAPALAGEPVGTATEVKGDVTVMHTGAASGAALKQGDPIFGLDTVTSGADGHASIHFTDESDLVVSGKGKLVVQDYLYDAQHPENSKSRLNIVGAAFSYIGGLIEKRDKADVKLQLDYGSIGIRGTKILGALADGADWVYLDEGKVTFTNEGGEVILNPGEGTQASAPAQAPKTPYRFSPEEVAFLKKLVDDPTALNASIAANTMPLGHVQPSQMAAADTARQVPAAPSEAGGGGAMFENETPADQRESKQKEEAPAARAAAAVPASPPPAAGPAAASEAPVAGAANMAEPAPAATRADNALSRAKVSAGKIARKPVDLFAWKGTESMGLRFTPESDGSVRIDNDKPQTVNIAKVDLSKLKVDDTVLHFSAQMKEKGLAHPAYLQLLLHLPGPKGGGYYFSNALDHPLMTEGDWETFTAPFTLKKGEVPDEAVLNIVMTGAGTVWVKDVHLTRD